MSLRLQGRSMFVSWVGMFLALVTASSALAGGIRVDVEFAQADATHPSEKARIWISERRIRFERITPGVKSSAHVLIYLGDQDLFYSIHPNDRAYVEVDRQLIVDLGLPALAARRDVDSQLARLPRDQHAMLERLLGAREGEGSLTRHPLRVVPVAGSAKVGSYTCRRRDLMRKLDKIGEVCLVPWSEVGIKPKDLEVFRQLANFQRELMGASEMTPLEIVPNQPLDLLVQLDGFPLYMHKWSHGVPRSVIRVTDARPIQKESSWLFRVPAGYRERDIFSLLLADESLIGEEVGAPDPTTQPPARNSPAVPAP